MDDVEERYYQTLSDRKLFELRDSIPHFKDRFYELEKEVLEFLKNLDVDAIEIGKAPILRYQNYSECKTTLNNYNLHLKNIELGIIKSIFF